jgi:hypothetical protein
LTIDYSNLIKATLALQFCLRADRAGQPQCCSA